VEFSLIAQRAPQLFAGLVGTVELAALGSMFAFAVGAGLTYIHFRAPLAFRWFARGYTALCLGLPLLVVIYVLFYVLPDYDILLEPKTVGVCALAIYYGPYFGEVMRAAIQAIGVGQIEAAQAVGLPPLRLLRRVLLPQALPLMLPPFAGLLIGLVKDTALLSIVSVQEFMYFAKEAVSDTYAPLEIYFTVAVTYWILTASMAGIIGRVERRLLAFRGASQAGSSGR
jgi:polar amino acid transport system permease protein